MANKFGKRSVFNAIKRKLAGKEETALDILSDVKKVKPQQWRNTAEVEKLARNYIGKLGLKVSDQRIKQFMAAYTDVTRNGSSVDEMIKKYGKNVDEETAKTIKKYTNSV